MITRVRRFLAAVPAVTGPLLSHVGGCPACWPLVGGFLSSTGLTFLVETRYLLPIMLGCLVIAVAALRHGARGDHRAFALGVVAASLILVGKFVLHAAPITFVVAGLLVGACVWDFWLRRPRKALLCPSCVPPAAAATNVILAPKRITNGDLPIACALDQAQFAERKQLADRLAQAAMERRRLPNGVGLRFKAVSGRVTELAKFVDLERACCPFLTFRIEALAGEPVWLELTGPMAAQEIIRKLIPEVVPYGRP